MTSTLRLFRDLDTPKAAIAYQTKVNSMFCLLGPSPAPARLGRAKARLPCRTRWPFASPQSKVATVAKNACPRPRGRRHEAGARPQACAARVLGCWLSEPVRLRRPRKAPRSATASSTTAAAPHQRLGAAARQVRSYPAVVPALAAKAFYCPGLPPGRRRWADRRLAPMCQPGLAAKRTVSCACWSTSRALPGSVWPLSPGRAAAKVPRLPSAGAQAARQSLGDRQGAQARKRAPRRWHGQPRLRR